MKLAELLNELSFYGRTCTKDCSGHRAGWEWERKHQTQQRAATPSNSFNNGTEIAVSQAKQGQRPVGASIRGEKGRFQKFQPVKETSLNELFDRPADWYWETKEQDHMAARFTVNDRPYVVLMMNELMYDKETGEWEDQGVWDVEFQDPTANDPHGITGKLGSTASIVFATVISILTKFKNDNPTLTLKFTAEEPSRQKLYNRILGVLQQKGYKVHSAKSGTGKMGYLVR